jgi:hypothetical protein
MTRERRLRRVINTYKVLHFGVLFEQSYSIFWLVLNAPWERILHGDVWIELVYSEHHPRLVYDVVKCCCLWVIELVNEIWKKYIKIKKGIKLDKCLKQSYAINI